MYKQLFKKFACKVNDKTVTEHDKCITGEEYFFFTNIYVKFQCDIV